MRQLSLFDDDNGAIAGVMPAIRAAMNRAAGADAEGRKRLVDRINAVATNAGVRLTQGNTKAISKDLLDKWLSPSDREHTPSLLAVVVFCKATGDPAPLRAALKVLGLDVMTAEDKRQRDYGRACLEEKAVRKRKKMLEENI